MNELQELLFDREQEQRRIADRIAAEVTKRLAARMHAETPIFAQLVDEIWPMHVVDADQWREALVADIAGIPEHRRSKLLGFTRMRPIETVHLP